MNLKDFTDEELRAELKRRSDEKKAENAKALRCRNCVHIFQPCEYSSYKCKARGYMLRGYAQNYVVSPSRKACEHFKLKIENGSN